MFTGAAEHYDLFMGRYSGGLAEPFADFAGIQHGQRVLDVGSGPGALTTVLVERLGSQNVAAADPSEPYVAAARERHRGVDVVIARAEELPFPDAAFDAALAQLVVHFLKDPVAGLREMARVTRSGGTVAACVWDHEGGGGPLSGFWAAVHELDPAAHDESGLPGARGGHLTELLTEAGLDDVTETLLRTEVEHPTFESWWEPYTLGVGPAGAYVRALDDEGREHLREACRRQYPREPFTITASAWAARGTVR
jgi:ubiquinone/menaquinone biosynthesis C-methylase UbiE